MPIIGYDPQRNQGYGSLFFADREADSSFYLFENIWADLEVIDALVDLGRLIVTGWVTPVIKIKSGLDDYPFLQVPEARYKIGNYNYGSGAIVSIDSEGIITSTPIDGTPHYIVYATQCLEVSRFSFQAPAPSVVQFGVLFEPSPPGNEDAFVINPRLNSSSSPSNFIASSFQLNLSPGLVADLKLYYSFQLTALDFFADTREVQPVLI